jgi:hypothetical protein
MGQTTGTHFFYFRYYNIEFFNFAQNFLVFAINHVMSLAHSHEDCLMAKIKKFLAKLKNSTLWKNLFFFFSSFFHFFLSFFLSFPSFFYLGSKGAISPPRLTDSPESTESAPLTPHKWRGELKYNWNAYFISQNF